MTNVMKAVQLHAFGGPENLVYEDAPRPTVGEDEVLVKVHAAGLNPPDLYLRDGYRALPPKWRPGSIFLLILGTDISGVVAEVGANISAFRPGDEVYSMVRFPEAMMSGSGAYADYVSVPASQVAFKPKSITHTQAAAAPMSILTAWQFLVESVNDAPNPFQSFQHTPVSLQGKTVLVNGASGGVGHLAVQIAKWKGAHVIAVASTRHEKFLYHLGADEFIDYTHTAAERVVKNIDLVVEAAGGPNMARFLDCLKQGGALFLVNPLGFNGQREALLRNITVSSTQVRSSGAQLIEAGHLLEKGVIHVSVDSIFPLAKASEAHMRAEAGSTQGKIVLTNC
ncbi:NADP-dependent oxidoreductase [Pantoea eucrina]|uniref:NADP-dependent oxidoreductase n=1 Tax=Pantoea eucrina TaxID=472693 RepID=A0ABU5LEJ6_9GAMM|nr:NADP-dependent oxidoreductase [Pantoea eucrina]MDZ7278374.1 NADP-dependent oxidoreductase [Pantoea eucrina]